MKKDKREVSKEWIDKAIDLLIGPNLAFLAMDSPEGAKALRKVMEQAIERMCKTHKDTPTRELIAIFSNQLNGMYGEFITVKLETYLKDGVPEKTRITAVDGWMYKHLN